MSEFDNQQAKTFFASIFEPERDAIGEFPASFKKYRVIEPFAVYAHSEEQARKRWEFFISVLEQLAANEWHSHDLVAYVQPERLSANAAPPTFEFVEEEWHDEFPRGGMSSGYLPEWDWLAPENDKDWNPAHLAYRIFAGQLEEEEEESLREAGDNFSF